MKLILPFPLGTKSFGEAMLLLDLLFQGLFLQQLGMISLLPGSVP